MKYKELKDSDFQIQMKCSTKKGNIISSITISAVIIINIIKFHIKSKINDFMCDARSQLRINTKLNLNSIV